MDNMFLRHSCLLTVDFELAEVDVMNFLSVWNKTDKETRSSSKRPLNNQVWSSTIPALLALKLYAALDFPLIYLFYLLALELFIGITIFWYL